MRFLKIFAGIVIFLIAVIAGLLFYAHRLDWNAARPVVEREVSELTGRTFEITGDLKFRVFPRPRVSAGGLRLGNAAWGSAPLMLEAAAVTFTISPLSIVLGAPKATAITMQGVTLLLEESADGRNNWHFGEDASGTGDQARVFTKLRSVMADDVNVTYKRPGAEPARFTVDTARVGSRPVGGGFGADIRGTVNDRPFSVTGNLTSVSEFLAGRGLHGRIDLESQDLQATLEGDFGRPPRLAGSDFAVHGRGDGIPAIAALEALPDDMRGKWQADLKFAGLKTGYRISDADLHLSDYRFQGDLAHDDAAGYSGDVEIEAPDYKLQLQGQFGSLASMQGIDATVAGSGTGLPAVGALTSIAAHVGDAWQANFHVKGTPDRVQLDDLKLTLGRSDIAGTLSLIRSGPRPRIEGKLTSDLFVTSLLDKGDEASVTSQADGKAAGNRVLSDEPIPTDWVKVADASVEITAKRVEGTLFNYENALIRGTLDNGRLELASEKGTIYGAESTGLMQIDATVSPPRVVMEASARGADVGKVTGDWSDPPFMTGQGDFEVKISSTGDSVAALMANLSGDGRVVVGEGSAQVGVLERMVKTVGLKTIGGLLGEDKVDSVPMKCFAANLTAKEGVVKADVLVLDTEKATIFGSGTIDLAKEQFDLVFKPKPKSVTLNTAVPIRVGGTFQDPTVSAEAVGTLRKIAGIASLFVFPPAAIAGLADFGSGNNQCVKLAAQSK